MIDGVGMSTVTLLDAAQAPLLARRFFEGGSPGPIVSALAHVPELLEPAMPFLSVALSPTAIDIRTKELVILRTSALMGCRYCTQTHAAVALRAGLDRVEVSCLMGLDGAERIDGADRADGAYGMVGDPGERALLAWVDAVVRGDGAVADEASAGLRDTLGEAALVELALVVGATMMLNVFCTTLHLPTDPRALVRLEQEGLG